MNQPKNYVRLITEYRQCGHLSATVFLTFLPNFATSHSFKALTGRFPSKMPSFGSSIYHPDGSTWLGPDEPTCKLTSQSTEVPINKDAS